MVIWVLILQDNKLSLACQTWVVVTDLSLITLDKANEVDLLSLNLIHESPSLPVGFMGLEKYYECSWAQ